MADTYFTKLSKAEDLPPAFDGIASSLDELFSNLALYGVDITFGDPDYPPNPDPEPGPPPFPEDSEETFSDTHQDPPAPVLADATGQPTDTGPDTKRLVTMQLEALADVEVGLPAFDDVKFVLNRDPFEVKLSLEPNGFLIEATVGLAIRFDSKLLVPMVDTGGGKFEVDPTVKSVDILVASTDVKITEDGVAFDFGAGLVLSRPAMIGQTGVIVEAANLSFNFDGTGDHPDAAPAGWKGVMFNDAKIRIPAAFDGAIAATKLGFGSGGVTGTIAKTFALDPNGTVLGMKGGVTEVAISLRENILTGCAISASVVLPFFDPSTPLDVLISICTDGTLTATLKGSLATLTIGGVAQFSVTRITFGVEQGTAVAAMGGLLTPTAGGLDWPSFEIENLRVDAQGNVTFAGGWIDLDKQLCLNLYGFQLEITRIGFGKNDAGENWIGFNGALKLLEGVPSGASVEGLRILWGGSGGVHVTLEGVGVELEVPGVVKIAGKVSLSSSDPREFKGAVRVELSALSVEIDGQFVAGTATDPNGNSFKSYAVYLQMQLPTGIPLGTTGLAFYGFSGLYAHNREPAKLEGEGWYRNPDLKDGWYTRGDPDGITDVTYKWRGARGHMGFGAGIILGTYADNGYLFNGRLLLVLAFPGPVILIEGMANLLKKRTSLGEGEPNFHALVVIDPGNSITAGLDAQYKFGSGGELLEIRGSAQTFFDFNDPTKWYINIGVNQPPQNRIRARAFKLFDLNSFFMLSPKQLEIGGGWSYRQRWGFKHLYVGLNASLDTDAIVSWHPAHFKGSISLAGGAELHAFFVNVTLSIGTTITGDVFDPFALAGDFSVHLNLPWPLPDVGASIHLEWKEDHTDPPPLPVPVREGSIEHLKSRNTWPLTRGKSLFGDAQEIGDLEFERPGDNQPDTPVSHDPPFDAGGDIPTIPADSKIAVTFTRPIDDPNRIAIHQQAKVEPEIIGDRSKNLVTYTVGYSLKALSLEKWAPGKDTTDGTAEWTVVRTGGAKNADNTPQLSVAWQPGTEDPDVGHSEQNKMLVNAVTPFDYTADRSKTWQDWFVNANSHFPCPLAIPELSARFTDPVGTHTSQTITFTDPAFTVNWIYGGDIGENDLVIPTVLGQLDRGLVLSMSNTAPPQDSPEVMMTITPPSGHEDILVRLGSPKRIFRKFFHSFSSSDDGSVPNPLTVTSGETVTRFDGQQTGTALSSANKIVTLSDGGAGLEVGSCIRIEAPMQPMYIEIDVQVASTRYDWYEAFGVDANGVEGPHNSLSSGHNTLRFRGSDTVPLASVIVRRSSVLSFSAPSAYLRRISWRPPLVARAYGESSSTVDYNEPLDGLFHINLAGLNKVEILGRPPDGMTLLEMALPAGNEALIAHALDSLSQLTKEDPLFEADTDYRLVVTSGRKATDASGIPTLSTTNTFTHHAYFHVAGPPGVGVPDQPPEQPAASQTGDTGLSNLRLYVEQTLPNSIPAEGGKLILSKAFYRGYDVAVKFNEAYTELLYLLARRSLTTRLFDVHDNPVATADGRAFIPIPSWERSRQASLKESVAQWIGMVNGAQCRPDDLPVFDSSTVVRNQVFSAPSEELILAAETLYQARLVPTLLHETFVGALSGLVADGEGHRLERWSADSGGGSAPLWKVDSESIAGFPDVFFVTETTGNASSLVYVGPLGARDDNDQPGHWSDFRASVQLRWAGGIVGLDLRWTSNGDMIRLTLDRDANTRRLAVLSGGSETSLADDTTSFPDPGTDVLITVECVGSRVQVFQDGAATPIFNVSGAPTTAGTLALRAEGATNVQFAEIRVDDLRQNPSSAFTFDFVTSKYTNFHHHVHSYSDLLFDAVPGTALNAADLAAQAAVSLAVPVPAVGDGLGAVSDEERRGFELLEAKVLGASALRSPGQLQILRVSAAGEPTALLVRSPEPLLWERTTLEVSISTDATPLAAVGDVKLTDVTFGNSALDESVTILVRSKTDLSGYRLEYRPLPVTAGATWSTYVELGGGSLILDDGMQVKVLAAASNDPDAQKREPGTLQRFVATDKSTETVHFASPGVELRLLASDGITVVHQRPFRTPDAYSPFPMRALRKLDGTAILLFPDPLTATSGLMSMRLQWRFARVLGDEDLRFRQSGSEAPEVAALDVVLSPTV